MKPILKWVGGKAGLLPEIQPRLPKFVENEPFTLVEPFAGALAVSLWAVDEFDKVDLVINDANKDLVNLYEVVRDVPDQWLGDLKIRANLFLSFETQEERKACFLRWREVFNHRELDKVKQASLFVVLNKTCFNGMWRVNGKGECNSPVGTFRPKGTQFVKEDDIYKLSSILKQATLTTGDFEAVLALVADKPNVLWYMDPPYRPISKTANFTRYTQDGFNEDDQIRLAKFCEKLTGLGHHVMVSNSWSDDGFFNTHYPSFNHHKVQKARLLASKVSSRGVVDEILLTNY